MAKFRIAYGDGTPLGQYDNLSELQTALDHSAPGWRDRVKDRRDDHNFTTSANLDRVPPADHDKLTFIVSGPPVAADRDGEPQG